MSIPSNDAAGAQAVEQDQLPTFASSIEGEPVLTFTKDGIVLTANCISHGHGRDHDPNSHSLSVDLSTLIGNHDGHLIWGSDGFHLSASQIHLEERLWLVATLRTMNGDYSESRLDLNEGLRVGAGDGGEPMLISSIDANVVQAIEQVQYPTFAASIEGEPVLSFTKGGVLLTANCISRGHGQDHDPTTHRSSINLSTGIGNHDGHLVWCSAGFHHSAFHIHLEDRHWLVATVRTKKGEDLESRLDLNEGLRVEEEDGEMVFVCPHDHSDTESEAHSQSESEHELSSLALSRSNVGEGKNKDGAIEGRSSSHSSPTSKNQDENQMFDPATSSLHEALLDLTSNIVPMTRISYFRSLNHLLNSSVTSSSTFTPNDTDTDSNTPLDWTPFIEKDATLFLGGGRFGDVYKGSWTNIPSSNSPEASSVQSRFPQVVVKIMRPLAINERDRNARRALKYLQREIAVWQRLEHENIVPFLGVSKRFGPVPSLISVWMANGSCNEYLSKYPEADRIGIIRGIARGLKYLHSHDPEICHGDLKAANILISSTGSVCISDFGLSRIVDQTSSLWSTTTSSNAPGSIRWMAPELINGTQRTVHTPGDIYAYAMTCLEIMTNKLPFAKYSIDAAVICAVVFNKERPARPGPSLAKVKLEEDNSSIPDLQTQVNGDSAAIVQPVIITDLLWHVWEDCWKEDAKERLRIEEVLRRMEAVWEEYNIT